MLPADADLDGIVAQLRQDPVVVERALGAGEAVEYHDRLARLVREVPFPVYVLFKDEVVSGSREQLDSYALLLSRRLGPGLYLLGQKDSVVSVTAPGYGLRNYATSPMQFEAVDVVEKIAEQRIGAGQRFLLPDVIKAETVIRAAEAAGDPKGWEELETGSGTDLLAPEESEDLAERAVALDQRAAFRPTVMPYVSVEWVDPGRSTMRGVWAGAGIAALIAFLGLAPWRRRHTVSPARVPDLGTELVLARRDLERLAAGIDAATAAGRQVEGEVLLGLDAARQRIESEEVADVIGTRILASTARARLDGRRYRVCFFDPRHPQATGVARWRLGQGQVEVPVCPACEKAITRGRTPQVLQVARRGATVPYYERQDVWARTGYGALGGDLAGEVLAERGRR